MARLNTISLFHTARIVGVRLLFATCTLAATAGPTASVRGAVSPLAGHWEGTIARDSKTWRVDLDVESRPAGPVALIDLVDLAVYGIPFTVMVDSEEGHTEPWF